MSQPTNEPLPFTEQRGRLYIAPLTAELPDLTVHEQRFVNEWPAAWTCGGETAPDQCSVEPYVTAEDIRVADRLTPLATNMAPQRYRWTFGMDHANMERVPWSSLPPLPEGQVPWAPRFMLGWESKDHRSRVIARQVTPSRATVRAQPDVFALTYQLEQAYAPLPPQPERRWWQRLLFWRRPPIIRPNLYPPFEVWQVGELRKAI